MWGYSSTDSNLVWKANLFAQVAKIAYFSNVKLNQESGQCLKHAIAYKWLDKLQAVVT